MKARLFLVSFLILFLELALIRFIPANIRLIGYFSNLILLGTFLGMGLGILLSRHRFNLLFFFPLMLLVLTAIVIYFKVDVNIRSADAIFFKPVIEKTTVLETEYILPIIFLLVALTFIPLSTLLGQLFTKFKPLAAYSIDILGSLAGIAVFSVLSFLSAPPFFWFLIVSLVFSGLILTDQRIQYDKIGSQVKLIACLIAAALVVFVVLLTSAENTTWSPYYKITVSQDNAFLDNPIYTLNANNIVHQYIGSYKTSSPLYYTPFYFAPYQSKFQPDFKNVLIIGGGSGIDVAVALGFNPNISHIDAVEIDPKIYEFGKKLNPDHPYDDPRVSVHINDGRNFLQTTNQKYDLIIFALTDSLTLSANTSNIRLESFLYTTDSFRLAREHLTGDGAFVLYNFYRENWLIEKLALMSQEVFGYPPYMKSYGDVGKAAVIMTGPKILDLEKSGQLKPFIATEKLPPAQDDWPFLYIKNRTIPFFYLKFMAIVGFIAVLLIFLTQFKQKGAKLDFRFFFLGAGFLLLETKSLVTFGLLFGTTWLINSLVFSAILLFVLLANLISIKYKVKTSWLFLGLFGLLILNILVPPAFFANFTLPIKLILASIFYFTPVFLANLIFSQTFKDSQRSDISLASNLLGAVLGGLFEYAALAIGYQMLGVFIALFYALALLKLKKTL